MANDTTGEDSRLHVIPDDPWPPEPGVVQHWLLRVPDDVIAHGRATTEDGFAPSSRFLVEGAYWEQWG